MRSIVEPRVLLALLGILASLASCARFDAPIGIQASKRDAFPVFDNPTHITRAEADARGAVRDGEAVIGVALNGEAKAYPIAIMGVHELGNDRIGDVPIAVSW